MKQKFVFFSAKHVKHVISSHLWSYSLQPILQNINHLWEFLYSQTLHNPLRDSDAIFVKLSYLISWKVPYLIFIGWLIMVVWDHLSRLSNGESLWIQTVNINISGSDPGTKNKTKVVHRHVKKQTPICINIQASKTRPLSDLTVISFVYAMCYWGSILWVKCT